jgi:hypothetical protein
LHIETYSTEKVAFATTPAWRGFLASPRRALSMNNKAWGRWSETVGKIGNAAAQAAAENAARCDLLHFGVGTAGPRLRMCFMVMLIYIPNCAESLTYQWCFHFPTMVIHKSVAVNWIRAGCQHAPGACGIPPLDDSLHAASPQIG